MRFGVVQFPGSNCDSDAFHVLKDVMKKDTVWLWHKDHDLKEVDCVVLPGGFSYGDYLRSGAIARFSPLMQEVKSFARKGGLVLGICNGFQILLELGLLPGAMLRNRDLKFICDFIHIKVDNPRTPFSRAAEKGRVLSIPIAHFDGNYYAPRPHDQGDRGQQTGRLPLLRRRRPGHRRGQSQRLHQRHRGPDEQAGQRHGHDAPPGTGLRGRSRQHRRPGHLLLHNRNLGIAPRRQQAAGGKIKGWPS